MSPGGRDSSSQVRIASLADTADSKKPSIASRQMSTTTGQQNQELASLYRVDDAKSVVILKKWQQTEDESERIAAIVGQTSNVNRGNPYSDVAAAATSATANEKFWSMSSASIIAQDMLEQLGGLRLQLLADNTNISGGLILASSAIIVVVVFIFAALIHKLKARRRAKDAKVGPSVPDIIKRRNSNELCSSDGRLISRSLALQPLDTSTTHTCTTGLARKSSRRRSSSESSPPNAAFTRCHQRDMAFAKDRRADTLVNAMPPDMGGKYKQRIFFARRHSLTQSTCRALDAALSAESGGNNTCNEEEISISSSAFDLDV